MRSPLRKSCLPNSTFPTRSVLRDSLLLPRKTAAESPACTTCWRPLADPNHEDHENMRDWIDSFDPEAFSIDAVQKKAPQNLPRSAQVKVRRCRKTESDHGQAQHGRLTRCC